MVDNKRRLELWKTRRCDSFRRKSVIEVKSSIAADGKLTAWEFHNYHSGMAAIETLYALRGDQSVDAVPTHKEQLR